MIISFLQEHSRFDITSDVKTQLKVFEQIDEVERKHREAREREMLMRVAKVYFSCFFLNCKAVAH